MKLKKIYISKLYKDKIIYDHLINEVCIDSRKVKPNDVFVAISGSRYDGNDYLKEAIKNGAKTIITEEKCFYEDVNIIVVENSRKELARILKYIYRNIMKKVKVIGVTGTNGKTTTTTLLHKYLNSIGLNSILIGSNGINYKNVFYEGVNTTPDITVIYNKIYEAYLENCNYVIIEVSSHAIKQFRIYGIEFNIALLTNLTLDHLDYHDNFTDYKYVKGLFISSIKDNNYVILNKDIDHYHFYSDIANAKVVSFGTKHSDFKIKDIELLDNGSNFNIIYKNSELSVNTNLIGMFNVYNIAGLIAIITALNIFNKKDVTDFFKNQLLVPGRMEEIDYNNRKIIIDFAHTPDGIFNVLSFLKTLKRRIILVIGCGGSRDKTKRRVVGEISVNNSDYVIFTSDNPRDEEEMDIINDIVRDIEKTNYEIITDRRKAITRAIKLSVPNDIIAILGRGNEQYQKVKGMLIRLNDKDVVKEIIKEG